MTAYSFSTDAPTGVKAGVLILPVFQGPVFGPGVKETGLEQAYRDAKLTGKKGESLLVTRRDGDRFAAGAVLLHGVGEQDFDLAAMRKALGRAGSTVARFGHVATTFPQAVDGDGPRRSRPRPRGSRLGEYRFDRYKSEERAQAAHEDHGVGDEEGGDRRPVARRRGAPRSSSEAVCWARDLVNTPAGDLPPAELGREAQAMAKAEGLACKVWTEADLKRGFGGILGVGRAA